MFGFYVFDEYLLQNVLFCGIHLQFQFYTSCSFFNFQTRSATSRTAGRRRRTCATNLRSSNLIYNFFLFFFLGSDPDVFIKQIKLRPVVCGINLSVMILIGCSRRLMSAYLTSWPRSCDFCLRQTLESLTVAGADEIRTFLSRAFPGKIKIRRVINKSNSIGLKWRTKRS